MAENILLHKNQLGGFSESLGWGNGREMSTNVMNKHLQNKNNKALLDAYAQVFIGRKLHTIKAAAKKKLSL